jgi:3-oxoadipate enol-lactonase
MIHSVVWDGQIGEFSKQYKTICYDRRGYGKSPQTESEYSNVEDLNTLLEELEIKRANLIGMSSGARISIDFAIQYPEKVSSLVLVGSVVRGFSFTRHFFLRGGHATIDILNDPKAFLNYMFTEDSYSIYRENKDLNLNSISKLNNIKVPTLIISGEFDIPDVHAHSGAINAAIPNSRRVVVNEAAHLVPFEKSRIFNEYVIGFYKNIKLISMIEKKGVEFAVEFYMKKIKENPDKKYFTEERLNELGYKYLYEGRVIEAIDLFKLNVTGYPKSSNVYDSLGEAYMEKGEKELAIKNYEKSLELNPENQNAVIKLEELREK